MSELKLNAEVTVDNAQSSAALKATAADLANAKVAIVDTAKASVAARRDLAELEKGAKGASAAVRAELEPALKAAKIAVVDTAQAARVAATDLIKIQRAANDVAPAIDKVTRSAGQARAGSIQLGQQLQDVAVQAQAGTSAFTIFAQQGGQVAFALSQMGGVAGKVGTVLSGPLGAGLILAVSLLGPFVAKLFETEVAADKATKGLSEFQRRQQDIGNFIDATTGRLTEQNKTLVQNAILTRQAAIDKNRSAIAEGSKSAFTAAGKAAVTGSQFVAERQPFRTTFDPAILDVIRTAQGDVEKLDAGLAALAKRRPDLAATVKTVSDAAAEAVVAARDNKRLAGEIDQLTGKVKGQGAATASLIEKQVALRTATTPLERARAQYNLVLTEGTAAEKAGGAALEAYRAKLTAAATAVNAAEAGQKASNKTLRDSQKELRATAKEAEKLAAALDKIGGGQIGRNITIALPTSDSLAETLRNRRKVDEPGTGPDDDLSALSEKLGKNYVEEIDAKAAELGKKMGDGFSQVAGQVGDIIGGKLGSKINGIAYQLQGLSSLGGSAGSPGTLAQFTKGFNDQNSKLFGQVTGKLDGIFGGKTGAFGAAAGKAFAGAAQGEIAGSVLKGLGVKTSKLGSQLGGAAGAFLPIPGGALIGGAIGGVLGGLLKKPKTGSATIGNVDGAGAITGTSGNSAGQKAAATALGNTVTSTLQQVVNALGGELGTFAGSIGKKDKKFVVDPTGAGRTKGAGTIKFKDEGEAVQALIADALKDGAVAGVSPRVQAVLRQYAGNIDKAVAEALKVKNLEDLVASDSDPFAGAFRDAEKLRADRLTVAKKYGFDVLQIEKINAKERAAAIESVLSAATGSVRDLLNDLQFGSRATGSGIEQQASLQTELDRLTGLIKGGDTSQLDAAASIAQKLIDIEAENFGATKTGARDTTTALLQDLVRQTEDRIRASAKAAEDATKQTNTQLTTLNNTGSDQVNLLSSMDKNLAALIAQIGGGGLTPSAALGGIAAAALYGRQLSK